jgi:hypothetical protein
MRAFSTPLLAALLAVAVSPALAAPAAPAVKPAAGKPAGAAPAAIGTSADVRCLLSMVALGNDKDRQQAAQLGV